jgi:hypothetical protein
MNDDSFSKSPQLFLGHSPIKKLAKIERIRNMERNLDITSISYNFDAKDP